MRLAEERDIALAYRLILRREPDAEGLAHYSERVRQGLALTDLIDSLLGSDEFKNRPVGPDPGHRSLPTDDQSSRGPADAPDLIAPEQVIQKYTVAELLATADQYYKRVTDPTPLMIKPWSFLHETPDLLRSLGLLLSGLHLGKTMTVLDFGAGTCWLSRCLAQLNCRPICCDASEAALEIGRRLFTENPLLGTAVYRPTFLLFDGHRIDLPDRSVDRIICCDAFHHVPNQAEVIAEFARVLRPGGIAGFSEPGRAHSRSPQAQYEMRNHRVLENDIRLEDIFALAQPVGFTELTVKVLNGLEISLADFSRIVGGTAPPELKDVLWTGMHDAMFNQSIFFLHKGPLRPDSRSHVGLSHKIQCAASEFRVPPGKGLDLSVVLSNTGAAAWLCTNDEIFGIVRLATHLYAADGSLLEIDHSRHDLPRDVAQGRAST